MTDDDVQALHRLCEAAAEDSRKALPGAAAGTFTITAFQDHYWAWLDTATEPDMDWCRRILRELTARGRVTQELANVYRVRPARTG